MNFTAIGIIGIITSIIYWIFIKDGQFKEGLGKFSNGKYADAISNFNKAILKNPNHSKAYFYL